MDGESVEYAQRNNSTRYLPALALIYVCGIAAVQNSNWEFLKASLIDPRVKEKHLNRRRKPVEIIAEEMKGNLRADIEWSNRVGPHLEDILHGWCGSIFHSQIPLDDSYNFAFDLFDILMNLLYLAYNTEGKRDWFPSHMTVNDSTHGNISMIFGEKGGWQGQSWELLRCDLFNGDRLKLYEVLQEYILVRNAIRPIWQLRCSGISRMFTNTPI